MHLVGVKELKTKLSYYLGLTKKGDSIIVTERGAPVAILHNLDTVEENAAVEEKLASLSKRGLVNLPIKRGALPSFENVEVEGKPLSEMIIEDRR